MPSQSRPITLTTAVGGGGIRCYTKTSDGIVRELCYDDDQTNKGWYPGKLSFTCGVQSALCAISWPGGNISVFYQDNKGTIREKYHNHGWKDPKFEQPGCLEGTNIAAVHDEKGDKVVLFYQNVEGYVFSRTRDAQKWGSPVHVGAYPAMSGTGIAAVVLKDAKGSWQNIRVYFQDKNNIVNEFVATYNTPHWTARSSISWADKHQYPIGDITAVSWNDKEGSQIRMYIQDQNAKIAEYSYTGGAWREGQFKEDVVSNADMCAVVRPVRGQAAGVSLHVYWAGQDRHIYQRVNVAGKWGTPSQVSRIMETGKYAGSWIGQAFTDNDKNIDSKRIKAVHVRELNGRIVGLRIDYTDGTSTGDRGISGRNDETFDLNNGDITQIWYHGTDMQILGLKFGTNTFEIKNGKREVRTSPWYGTRSKGSEVWSENGMAFVGFDGVQRAEGGIVGLQPLWSSTRLATADPSKIPELAAKVNELDGRMKTLTDGHAKLKNSVGVHSKKATADLKARASETATSIIAMAQSVEYLFDLSVAKKASHLGLYQDREQDFSDQKNKCKSNATAVETKTLALKDVAEKLKAEGDEIHVNIEKLQGNVATVSKELRRLKDSADALAHVLEAKKADTKHRRDQLKLLLPAGFKKGENDAQVIQKITDAGSQGQIANLSGFPLSTTDANGLSTTETTQLFHHAVTTLEARDGDMTRVDNLHKQLAAQLAELSQADQSSDSLEKYTNSILKDVRNLYEQDNTACDSAKKLAEKLKVLASKDLDNNSAAPGYATGLRDFLTPALQVDMISAALRNHPATPIHPDTLRDTMSNIAKHK